jgi:hypothetical protein
MQSRFAAPRSLPLVGLEADRRLAAQKKKGDPAADRFALASRLILQ